MVARARRPHASSRVATRARWDTPPLYDDDAFLFWETPRARALRESGVCRAFRPASRDPSIGYSASGARAGGDRKGTPSLPKPVARARVRDVHPDGCLPSGQSAKAFRFFSREIGARRAGRFPEKKGITGARSEAEPNRESRRSREARASRVEPAAREAETCRTCEYPRATARRGSPEPRAAFRLASRSPARLDPLPPSSNLRPVEICAIPLSTSPR